ncbi:Uncharacterised protein [Vibrio cholerae]|nr:Uncharacterised protein [Vibrio cholerae]
MLSPLDVILLKLLYEPELSSGMRQPQLQSLLKAKLKQYEQQGVLENAVQEARSSPLYEWLR